MPRKKVRTCGATCHNAKGPICRCWCGGLFHGAAAADARESFADQFGIVPMREAQFIDATVQPDLFDDPSTRDIRQFWRLAHGTALEARTANGGHDAVKKRQVPQSD